MKKLVLVVGVVMAQALAFSAFAQGEVGAVKKSSPPTKVSPEEKAAARATRKAEGTAAIKEQPPGEVGAVAAAPAKSSMSKEDKAAARAARKSDTAAANKAGTLPKTGEVGPTK